MNITAIDLNLLLAFEALFDERSVSKAAVRIHLSQPAMSNALSRLRRTFDDPLFVRTSRGISPSPRALELAGPLRQGLTQLRAALGQKPQFEPRTSSRCFRIAMTDYAEILVLGPLLRRLRHRAAGVQVLVRPLERVFVPPEAEIRAGKLDAAIGFFPEESSLEPGTHSMELFVEDNVCIARKGHPQLPKRLSLHAFAAADHLGIIYRDDTRGLIDTILAGHGFRRRLQVTTPNFLSVPHLIARSNLIAVVPEGLAARFRDLLPIEIRKLPIKLPAFHTRLLWHQHASEDSAHKWLRSEIAHCLLPD